MKLYKILMYWKGDWEKSYSAHAMKEQLAENCRTLEGNIKKLLIGKLREVSIHHTNKTTIRKVLQKTINNILSTTSFGLHLKVPTFDRKMLYRSVEANGWSNEERILGLVISSEK